MLEPHVAGEAGTFLIGPGGNMIRAARTSLLLFGALLWAVVPRGNAQNTMVENLRAEWEAERKEFGDIAAAMPADKFNFRATPEVRTFGEIVVHVVDDNTDFMDAVAGAKPGAEDRFKNLKSRQEILKTLTDHFDYGAKVLADLTEQKAMEAIPYRNRGNLPRWRLVMNAIGHAKEHYGNLVTYMRLNGMVPPTSAAPRPPRQPGP